MSFSVSADGVSMRGAPRKVEVHGEVKQENPTVCQVEQLRGRGEHLGRQLLRRWWYGGA